MTLLATLERPVSLQEMNRLLEANSLDNIIEGLQEDNAQQGYEWPDIINTALATSVAAAVTAIIAYSVRYYKKMAAATPKEEP